MISWLLAVVLLSATNAITTPTTSTEPTPKPSSSTATSSSSITTTTILANIATSSSGIITPAAGLAVALAGPANHPGELAAMRPPAETAAAAAAAASTNESNVMLAAVDEAALGSISGVPDHLRGVDQRTLAAAPSSSSSSSSSWPPSDGRHVQVAADGVAQSAADSNVRHHSKSASSLLLLNDANNTTFSQQQQQQQQQQPPPPELINKKTGTRRQQQIYTNQFVIQVEGGESEARKLAEKHGFIYLNHILGDYYHLEHRRLAKRSLGDSDMSQLEISIEDEPQVLKLERQVLKKRVKRDFLEPSATSSPPPSFDLHQAQQQQQLGRPLARPAAGRPAHHQLPRPANQPPSQAQPQNQPANNNNNANNNGRRINYQNQMSSPGGSGQQRQHFGDLLDLASSGPAPLFSAGNLSLKHHQQQQQQHLRPLPPPLANGNSTGQQLQMQMHANSSSQLKAAPFSDPSWPLMWYLDGGARNGFDLNVQAAWRMGYTGKGIVITILDDGLEKDHPDLQANYDPLASFDINGDDADPMPRYDAGDSNKHGTRCAGEVAAVPGNNICSIGIAYNSKVGGVRMLDGEVTDAVEARSLGLNNQHIHIYSASWGPDDNGKTVDGPGELATRAFIEGVTNGRQGLGSIFVFASGNGGREYDNCNCDGYTNSIWTLSISSATENGNVPWYIESCSSTLATTYSSGSLDERQITTTDIHHSCTSNHTGTSASAPLAAGICALVLESNPRLTWRDMQHIVVRTSRPANLVAKDWRTNALGRNVSHAFGYGLMNAAAMITMARQWTSVPVQYTCEVRSPQMEKFIPSKGYIELKLRAECANVRYLEHVQSKVTLTASRRGDLHVYLTSPLGTRSTLLAQRPLDQTEQGFRNWPFMTVHSWGESPNGIWTLEVHNDGKPQNRAYLKEWTLILYGTYDDPNKHLDANSLANSIPMAATPAPPQQQSPQQRPQPTSGRFSVPVAQSPPPAPSFAPTHSDPELVVAQKRPPPPLPAANQAAGQQAPSSSSPPPPISHKQSTPPPPPATTTTSSSTSTSTTSSYVTTFKTIVNANGANPVNGGRPPAPLADQQQQQPPAGRVQPTQAGRTDFDVVAPPSVGGHDQRPLWTFSTGHMQEPMATTTTTSSPAINQSDFLVINNNNNQNQKPSVDQLDDSKMELAGGSRPPLGNQLNLSQQNQRQQQQAEIDANQLESKQTNKDYRSSGGGREQTTTTMSSSSSTSSTGASNDLQPEGDNLLGSSSSSSSGRLDEKSSSSASSSSMLLANDHVFKVFLQLLFVTALATITTTTTTRNVVRSGHWRPDAST